LTEEVYSEFIEYFTKLNMVDKEGRVVGYELKEEEEEEEEVNKGCTSEIEWKWGSTKF
jgi:hypothetical protein